MQKLIEDVARLVEEEYGRAGAKFGLTNHSDHESYAVLLEEVEEAEFELKVFREKMDELWRLIKCNDGDWEKHRQLYEMRKRAVLAACEFIQVAAMCQKANITVCDRGATEEFNEEVSK